MHFPDIPVLLVPGIGDSGPGHWQSLWQRANPAFHRVPQRDWDKPLCSEWLEGLETAVRACDTGPLLIAHSLGCLLVAHWAHNTRRTIKAAMLVAVPDPHAASFPAEARGFTPVPRARFAFPSMVVGSENDPYAGLGYARACATAWGSRFVNIGPAGHINAASGHGEWHDGLTLLDSLVR